MKHLLYIGLCVLFAIGDMISDPMNSKMYLLIITTITTTIYWELMLNTMLNITYALSHLSFTSAQWCRYNCYTYFINEEVRLTNI